MHMLITDLNRAADEAAQQIELEHDTYSMQAANAATRTSAVSVAADLVNHHPAAVAAAARPSSTTVPPPLPLPSFDLEWQYGLLL
jgi:hypothetical protein